MQLMRKTVTVLLIAVFALCFAACGGKEGSEAGQENELLAPLPANPVYEGSDIAGSPFVGSFYCSWSALYASSTEGAEWQGRESTLVITEDGSFTLSFDSMEDAGMVTVSGTLKVTDDTARCTVESRSGENYMGVETAEFSLQLINENELRYGGEQQGAAYARDIYTREG